MRTHLACSYTRARALVTRSLSGVPFKCSHSDLSPPRGDRRNCANDDAVADNHPARRRYHGVARRLWHPSFLSLTKAAPQRRREAGERVGRSSRGRATKGLEVRKRSEAWTVDEYGQSPLALEKEADLLSRNKWSHKRSVRQGLRASASLRNVVFSQVPRYTHLQANLQNHAVDIEGRGHDSFRCGWICKIFAQSSEKYSEWLTKGFVLSCQLVDFPIRLPCKH